MSPPPAVARASEGRAAGLPAVSVIVPTYQRRELVKRAVASVLSQTHRDYELIVVDDGSTDGTGEALAALGDRVRYLWQPNRGVSAARNAALRVARGAIVAFLDSDDRWLPDHLAVVTEVLARQPEAVLVSTSPRHVIGGRARPAQARLVEPLPVHFFGNAVGFPSCTAVRRDVVLAAGGFDERLAVGEDGELWLRLALRGGQFSFVQRRTIVKQYTRLGLKEVGRRQGLYLASYELRMGRALQQLESRPEPRALQLARQARGALAFVVALQGLHRHDDRATRTGLEEACRALPELSREADEVQERLGLLPRATSPRSVWSTWPPQLGYGRTHARTRHCSCASARS